MLRCAAQSCCWIAPLQGQRPTPPMWRSKDAAPILSQANQDAPSEKNAGGRYLGLAGHTPTPKSRSDHFGAVHSVRRSCSGVGTGIYARSQNCGARFCNRSQLSLGCDICGDLGRVRTSAGLTACVRTIASERVLFRPRGALIVSACISACEASGQMPRMMCP